MVYAKIEAGAIVQYPCNLGDIRAAHPDVSIPAGGAESLGYVKVQQLSPAFDPVTQRPTEQYPVLVNGVWTQQWRIDQLPEQQAAANQRAIRDDLLRVEIDTINAVRWAAMTPEQQAAATARRQFLLDVPQQPGFPWVVVWQV